MEILGRLILKLLNSVISYQLVSPHRIRKEGGIKRQDAPLCIVHVGPAGLSTHYERQGRNIQIKSNKRVSSLVVQDSYLPIAFLVIEQSTSRCLHSSPVLPVLPVRVPPLVRGSAEVYTKLPAVDDLVAEDFLGLGSAGGIDEVGVGETSGLAGPAVNGHTDVHDVADVAEEIVEVLVRHLKRHVSNEESLGGRVGHEVSVTTTRPGVLLGAVELADNVTALEDLHVEVLYRRRGLVNSLEFDISETNMRILARAVLWLMESLPSAEAPVVVNDINALDLTEAAHDARELLLGDLVVQVADIDSVVGRCGGLVVVARSTLLGGCKCLKSVPRV